MSRAVIQELILVLIKSSPVMFNLFRERKFLNLIEFKPMNEA